VGLEEVAGVDDKDVYINEAVQIMRAIGTEVMFLPL